MSEKESLIEFPCYFPIKIMGVNEPSFIEEISLILQQHDGEFDAATIEQRLSSSGKYLSLTVNVYTTDKPHLDGIYQSLTSHSKTKYVL